MGLFGMQHGGPNHKDGAWCLFLSLQTFIFSHEGISFFTHLSILINLISIPLSTRFYSCIFFLFTIFSLQAGYVIAVTLGPSVSITLLCIIQDPTEWTSRSNQPHCGPALWVDQWETMQHMKSLREELQASVKQPQPQHMFMNMLNAC